MTTLSTSALATIEAAARRAGRRLAGTAVPVIVGIDVQMSDRGAVAGIAIGADIGAGYELDDLEPDTIRSAILDALEHATRGPGNWRRL